LKFEKKKSKNKLPLKKRQRGTSREEEGLCQHSNNKQKSAAKTTVFPAVRFCMNDADCGSCHGMTGDRPKAPSDGGSTSEHHPKGQWELSSSNARKYLHPGHL